MPHVPVSPATALGVHCEYMGEVQIPLFDPPYTVTELNIASADNWVFNRPTMDFTHIIDTGPVKIGTDRSMVLGFTDIKLNPFTYTTTKLNPNTTNPQYNGNGFTLKTLSGHSGNLLGIQSRPNSNVAMNSEWSIQNFISPFTQNKVYTSNVPRLLFKADDTSGWADRGADGFVNHNNRLVLQKGAAFAGIPTLQYTFGVEFAPLSLPVSPNQTIAQSSLIGIGYGTTLPDFSRGGFSYNYTPMNPAMSSVFPLHFFVIRWNWDCTNNGDANTIFPIIDDPQINSAFAATGNMNTPETLPMGFIWRSSVNYYTDQPGSGTVILMTKECDKYWRLKFVPQSNDASVAISRGNAMKFFIDTKGIVYAAATFPHTPRGIIFNSQGFSFPFQFNTPNIPYADLPCWPPCYGVPLMRSNLL